MVRHTTVLLVSWLIWLFLTSVLPAETLRAKDTDHIIHAVVTVMGLDDNGKPLSQGLGVTVSQDGKVLTSASLLSQAQGGVIKTSAGTIHLMQDVLYQDDLQDLALIRVNADSLASIPLGSAEKVHPPQKLFMAGREGTCPNLQEVTAVSTHPFSPRLMFVQLQPEGANTEPGSPLFTEQGKLVGMLHSMPAPLEDQSGVSVYLLHNFSRLPLQEKISGEAAERTRDCKPSCGAEGFVRFWTGVAASSGQDWKKAEEEFGAALTSCRNIPEAFYGRGVARYHLGDWQGSLEDLLEATKLIPTYALAFLWTGRAWERQGNTNEARKAYQQAAEQAPNLSEAWFHLGVLAYQEGNLQRAEEYLGRAEDNFSQAASRWWYLGQIAQAQKKWEKAWSAFRRALELDAKFTPAYFYGGKVLLELGRPREASQLLTKLIELEPQHAAARYHLAIAHLMSWNPSAAWEQYFTLQRMNPQLATRLASLLERGP